MLLGATLSFPGQEKEKGVMEGTELREQLLKPQTPQ